MDIAALAKAQMLGLLLEAVGAGGRAAVASEHKGAAPTTAPVSLTPGQVVAAVVTAPPAVRPGNSAPAPATLELSVAGRPLQAEIAGRDLPPAARQPGAVLQLRVESAGPLPKLAFLGFEPVAGPGLAQPQTLPLKALQPTPQSPIAAEPAARPILAQQTPTSPLAASITRATIESAARQGSAAPLYAALAPVAEQAEPPLPAPAAALVRALVETRLDAERPITPEALATALRQAAVPAEAIAQRADPPPLDARTLLAALRDLLRAGPTPAATPHPGPGEPPRRDAPPAAFRPSAPPLAPQAEPTALAATIAQEAEHAVERLKLHHLASLPEPRSAGVEPQRQQLTFELPLAFGRDTAIAGFRIERERRRKREDERSPIDTWGIRFAIDAEGIGPVQAHLRLTGSAVSVSLWAEEPATLAAFAAGVPFLEAALAEAALEVGEVAVLAGRPAEAKRPAGLLLDRVS
jgi:hypothetical protein